MAPNAPIHTSGTTNIGVAYVPPTLCWEKLFQSPDMIEKDRITAAEVGDKERERERERESERRRKRERQRQRVREPERGKE